MLKSFGESMKLCMIIAYFLGSVSGIPKKLILIQCKTEYLFPQMTQKLLFNYCPASSSEGQILHHLEHALLQDKKGHKFGVSISEETITTLLKEGRKKKAASVCDELT